MKNMKLWKVFLIVMSAAILPLALVGVGQAQQMTCWCLKPSQTEGKKPINYSAQRSPQKSEDFGESENSNGDDVENEEDAKSVSPYVG